MEGALAQKQLRAFNDLPSSASFLLFLFQVVMLFMFEVVLDSFSLLFVLDDL